MKIKLFLIVLFFLSIGLNAQTRIQNLVREGMNLAYDFKFDSAEKTFNKIIDNYPNSPEGYYRISLLHFWIYLGSKDPGEYQIFLKFADITQEKINKDLGINHKNFNTTYVAGNLFLFRAMAQATNNQSVDAFWSSKKAVSYFEETLKLNPRFYDAYLGLGLFDYAMSFVPDFLKWAVNLTGLSSDKYRGLQYIKKALHRGINTKTEAAFHLSKIYTDYLAEYDSAYIYLKDLTYRYPNNGLFTYQYAVSLIKGKKLDKALTILDKVIQQQNKKIPQITALAYYRRGEIYFKKNQFRSAAKNYNRFLELSRELDLTGVAALNKALCYKMLGKEEEFKQNLLLANNGNQDIFEDSYAMKKSEKYLSQGITPFELKIIRMENYLDAGNYKTVYDSLKNGNMLNIPNELKAIKLVYFADAAFNLKKYNEAIYACDVIAELDLDNEKWTIPLANLINARSKYSLGDKTSAKELLAEAESENDYDFKDYIQSQIEYFKRKLK